MTKTIGQEKPSDVDKGDHEKVHLLDGGGLTRAICGVKIGRLVPYREFSEKPCPECLRRKMV